MGIEFLYLEEKNNCVFLIKIKGTEKGLYTFQLQSPRVTPCQARKAVSQRKDKSKRSKKGPAPQQQAPSLASFALSPGLQSQHPCDRANQNTTALLPFKWQPCWRPPLSQKLRVKMQRKQTSLCVERACPAFRLSTFGGQSFFPHCRLCLPGGGNGMVRGVDGRGEGGGRREGSKAIV